MNIYFMGYVVMIGQLILSLSFLIILHELGHFLPAKWFKTRVEKFYLFFDPYFSLFKFKKGETEYGIGWLPLGGYVKISGMIDESMDKEQMKQPAQPWEFRSKPAWQRLIIMLGGVTVNFILGFLIFAMLLWHYGEQYIPITELKEGVAVDCIGEKLGIQNGDHILKIGEAEFTEFNPALIKQELSINEARTITVNRNGEVITLPVTDAQAEKLATHALKNMQVISPRMPYIINKVLPDSPAEKSGIKQDDKLVTFKHKPASYIHDFQKIERAKPNEVVPLQVLRGQDTLAFEITANDKGLIGIAPYGPDKYFNVQTRNYSLGAALPAGVAKGTNFLMAQVKAFGQMFKGKIKASESLGGFGSIANLFPKVWDWQRFWTMTAILSLILAFMNLLPVPGLDGGHVMFLLFEVVTGIKPSDKFLEYATVGGFVILIALMIFANGMDIFRAVKDVIDPCTIME